MSPTNFLSSSTEAAIIARFEDALKIQKSPSFSDSSAGSASASRSVTSSLSSSSRLVGCEVPVTFDDMIKQGKTFLNKDDLKFPKLRKDNDTYQSDIYFWVLTGDIPVVWKPGIEEAIRAEVATRIALDLDILNVIPQSCSASAVNVMAEMDCVKSKGIYVPREYIVRQANDKESYLVNPCYQFDIVSHSESQLKIRFADGKTMILEKESDHADLSAEINNLSESDDEYVKFEYSDKGQDSSELSDNEIFIPGKNLSEIDEESGEASNRGHASEEEEDNIVSFDYGNVGLDDFDKSGSILSEESDEEEDQFAFDDDFFDQRPSGISIDDVYDSKGINYRILSTGKNSGYLIPEEDLTQVKREEIGEKGAGPFRQFVMRNGAQYDLIPAGKEKFTVVGKHVEGMLQMRVLTPYTHYGNKEINLLAEESVGVKDFFERISIKNYIDNFILTMILRPHDGKISALEDSNYLPVEVVEGGEIELRMIDFEEIFPDNNDEVTNENYQPGTHAIRNGLMGFPQARRELTLEERQYTIALMKKAIENQWNFADILDQYPHPNNLQGSKMFSEDHHQALKLVFTGFEKFLEKWGETATWTLEDLFFSVFPSYKAHWDAMKNDTPVSKASLVGLVSYNELKAKRQRGDRTQEKNTRDISV